MGKVIGIATDHILALEGAEIPTLRVSGTVGADFSGSQLADAVVMYASEAGEVRVVLDSFGGFASDAFSFYDTVRAEGIRLHVDGRGTVASAATIIMAAAGRKRSRLYPNAEYLIHQATGGDAEGVARANVKMEDIYMELSGMTRAEVKRIMKQDKPMSAQDAKRTGFVGGIIELQKLAAHAVNPNTMSENTNKVKRVFAISRDKAAAALVTCEVELEVDVDAELQTQLDSAVNDLKAERDKIADLEASVKTKPEEIAAAVKAAEDKLKAEHAEVIATVTTEADKLKAEIAELKKTIPAKPITASASGDSIDTGASLKERFKTLTAEERAQAFEKVRIEAKAQPTTK